MVLRGNGFHGGGFHGRSAHASGSRGRAREAIGDSYNESDYQGSAWIYRGGIPAVDLTALARWFMALALLTIATLASAASWDDDSHYVPLGPRTGYYIVRPGSPLSHQLGVEAAPTSDTADPFRHGYGADALAFHFNHAGVLSAPPAYIVQAKPNEFYTVRLGSLIRRPQYVTRRGSNLWPTTEYRTPVRWCSHLLRDSGLQPVRRSWRKTITRRRANQSSISKERAKSTFN